MTEQKTDKFKWAQLADSVGRMSPITVALVGLFLLLGANAYMGFLRVANEAEADRRSVDVLDQIRGEAREDREEYIRLMAEIRDQDAIENENLTKSMESIVETNKEFVRVLVVQAENQDDYIQVLREMKTALERLNEE